MADASQTLIDLEKRFWQSLVGQKTDVALDLLNEPAVMVSGHGAMQFHHDGYREMADGGTMVVKSFAMSNVKVVFPTESVGIVTYSVHQEVAMRDGSKTMAMDVVDSSTWVKSGDAWKCVMHTESSKDAGKA